MTLKSSIKKAIQQGQRQHHASMQDMTKTVTSAEKKKFKADADKILKKLPRNIKEAAAIGDSEVLLFVQADASEEFHKNDGVNVAFTGGIGLFLEKALKKAGIDYFVYVQGVLPVVHLVVMWKSEKGPK